MHGGAMKPQLDRLGRPYVYGGPPRVGDDCKCCEDTSYNWCSNFFYCLSKRAALLSTNWSRCDCCRIGECEVGEQVGP